MAKFWRKSDGSNASSGDNPLSRDEKGEFRKFVLGVGMFVRDTDKE